MIHALIQGELIADAQARTSAAGKQFVTAQLRAAVGDETMLIGLVAFKGVGEKLVLLKKGDALAVTGTLKPNVWTDRQGIERRDWSLTVAGVMTLYEAGKRKKAVQAARATAAGDDFPDDDLGALHAS